MNDLVEFLRARLDEKEARAWAIHDVTKCDALLYEEDMGAAAAATPDCDCGYPQQVRREVAATRAIIGDQTSDHAPIESMYGTTCRTCVAWQDDEGTTEFGIAIPERWPCRTARTCVAEFSAHPDYQESWKL